MTKKNIKKQWTKAEQERLLKDEEALAQDADREMFGDDADYFEAAGIDDMGCK